MEQREQHAHHHRHNEAQGHIIVHQLRHQQAAEQRTEHTEAHGDGQGEILEGLARALCTVGHDAAHQDHAVGQAAQGDSRVHVRQRGRQRDGVSARGDGLEAEQLKQRTHEDVHARADFFQFSIMPNDLIRVRAAVTQKFRFHKIDYITLL